MRKCEKCGEMVDEAKAFCPACGHAFVEEEKRSDRSKFDQMGGTMQMGQTMYNKMLSDMGLDMSESQEKPVEPVKPAPQVVQPAVRQQILQPVATPATKPSASTKPAEPLPVTPRISKRTKWVIAAAVVAIVLFVLLIIVALAAFAIWRSSFR